jgi:hypothetical protein
VHDNAPSYRSFVVKSTLPTIMWGFGASTIFPALVTAVVFPVSAIKKFSERTEIGKLPGIHFDINKNTDWGAEKLFPGNLPKALGHPAKSARYNCPRELLWRKCCVNISKYNYLCNEPIPATFWIKLYMTLCRQMTQ